jgi:hypothetical protein
MTLDLTETVTPLGELDRIIDGDRFPLSPHVRTLKEIRAKLRPEPVPEPVPEPLPPQRHYEPPRKADTAGGSA